jgi:hypothetical protein
MRTAYGIDSVSVNACGVFMPIFKTLNPASEVKA